MTLQSYKQTEILAYPRLCQNKDITRMVGGGVGGSQKTFTKILVVKRESFLASHQARSGGDIVLQKTLVRSHN